ncbi:MAG TPA: hypothetical protein VIC26_05985 [Marinagarivorans sp.]
MPALTLCINTGSSSIKYSVYDGNQVQQHRAQLHYQSQALENFTQQDAKAIMNRLMQSLIEQGIDPLQISRVAHRVVFGGQHFQSPCIVDKKALDQLTQLKGFAPLHMPVSLAFIAASRDLLTNALHTAHFDTVFHQTIPLRNRVYGLTKEDYHNGIQRYGFHGLSYQYVAQQLTKLSARHNGRWLIAHLGSGASLCGIKNGKSEICTMGFSALDGLPMATRCGQIDPSVILYWLRENGLSIDAIENKLYRNSGLKGLSEETGDMQKLLESHTQEAGLAIDYFIAQVVQHIGKIAADLEGLDGIVFTGGVGENSVTIRQRILDKLYWLGVRYGDQPLAPSSQSLRLSSDESALEVWRIATDEMAVMAEQSQQLQTP